MKPRPAAPWLGVWRITFERPVAIVGLRSLRASSASALAVGYEETWKANLLAPLGTGPARSGDTFDDYGFVGQSPTTFFAPFRAGVVAEYESVRRGAR
ncbi:MAG: hypothetical protein ACT4OZ_03295 [Gemmatimonadota bacterium]